MSYRMSMRLLEFASHVNLRPPPRPSNPTLLCTLHLTIFKRTSSLSVKDPVLRVIWHVSTAKLVSSPWRRDAHSKCAHLGQPSHQPRGYKLQLNPSQNGAFVWQFASVLTWLLPPYVCHTYTPLLSVFHIMSLALCGTSLLCLHLVCNVTHSCWGLPSLCAMQLVLQVFFLRYLAGVIRVCRSLHAAALLSASIGAITSGVFNLQCSVAWHGIEVVPQLVIS